MKIELCEDNGFMVGGAPTLVVLQVTNDEGKVMRFPIDATKTVQEIYREIGQVADTNFKVSTPPSVIVPRSAVPAQTHVARSTDVVPTRQDPIKLNEIQREDIVKCVKVYPRDGNQDLKLGDEYRVIDIKKVNGRVHYYEVLDDKAPAQYRISVFPEEIQLLRKAGPRPVKKVIKDIIENCKNCQEKFAMFQITKGSLTYAGTCPKCGTDQEVTLPDPSTIKQGGQ